MNFDLVLHVKKKQFKTKESNLIHQTPETIIFHSVLPVRVRKKHRCIGYILVNPEPQQ